MCELCEVFKQVILALNEFFLIFLFYFFQEKETLKKENQNLKGELTNARTKITTLETQLSGVRQQSVRFMLEQMERLHTCKETDV